MLRRLIWPLAVALVFVASMPLVNGWVAHRLATQLVPQLGMKVLSHQYRWGYLTGQETYQLANNHHREQVRINCQYWGLGPKAVIFINQRELLTSQWRWHLGSLSITGQHHYVGSNPLFRQLTITTQISPTRLTHKVRLAHYQQHFAQQDGALKVSQFQFDTQASYPRFKILSAQHTTWHYQLKLDNLSIDSQALQFQLKGLQMQTQIDPANPLSHYKSDLQFALLHWRRGALPIDLEHVNTQITMQASRQAIANLNTLQLSTRWQEQLAPLIANGLHIRFNPLVMHSHQGKMELTASLAIAPTTLSHSSLDGSLLLQNASLELHAKTNTQFIDNLLPDAWLAFTERAIANGLIKQQGNILTANWIYQRGELKQKPDPNPS
ncbi:YdgA family protein [Celerinatantimonas yamalensis]|uniref:DUF945 family protein n=1 Tax=Celerinatantimonas yamalensis TaxID=559956 RepID=A0ABW9G6H8_9GAMM